MHVPETMQAMVLTGHGGIEKLQWYEDWPVPVPGPEQVLIHVGACGLNNTDINTRVGWYSKSVSEATSSDAFAEVSDDDPAWGGAPIAFPRIQGADVCGRVVAVGNKADTGLLGKRVIVDNWLRDWSDPLDKNSTAYFGSEVDGGYAQYSVIDHRNVGVVESDLSDAELATFSCSYTTGEGMLSRAHVKADEWVLVTGASGGVGSALIQLAKRRGAKVVALASKEKHAQLKAFEPDVLLDRAPENLSDVLESTIGQRTVSVVADIVGGPYLGQLLSVLERGGRYTCSGAIAGPMVQIDLRTFYLNDLTLTGSTVVDPKVFRNVIRYIEAGEVKPILAATYPLKKLHAVQQAFVQKQHIGNIVVCP